MARPRKIDTGLPPCVYEKRGTFFLVRRRRWFNLGRDLDRALDLARCFVEPPTAENRPILEYAMLLVARARQNAKGRGIPFALTKPDVHDLMIEANFRCTVTRTPFSLEAIGTGRDRPFAPSIDRISSDVGYERANCRMVCVATNFAMNRWGDAVLRRLAQHMV